LLGAGDAVDGEEVDGEPELPFDVEVVLGAAPEEPPEEPFGDPESEDPDGVDAGVVEPPESAPEPVEAAAPSLALPASPALRESVR
jgi:hypothetical protein